MDKQATTRQAARRPSEICSNLRARQNRRAGRRTPRARHKTPTNIMLASSPLSSSPPSTALLSASTLLLLVAIFATNNQSHCVQLLGGNLSSLSSGGDAWRVLEKRTATATAHAVRPGSLQRAKDAPPVRISDTDLLPFSEFNVNQPAFSDIMKSWPPTTLNSAQRQMQLQQQQRQEAQRQHRHRAHAARHQQQQQSDSQPAEVYNHLNEDFDDTIMTADESFELDQLAEPQTKVNYLGDLGDLIYAQLRQFYESSPRSPFSFGQQTSAAASSEQQNGAKQHQAGRLVMETLEDLLDDYYYDQYENSQVLYYGPQLARQGDIVEIGCYLPRDQPAEWTKSGQVWGAASDQQAAATATPYGRGVIRRSEFLGAKQNFSLKIFEARSSDSGNYRCNRMSRKYHKLIVVPARISTGQLYAIQQRLLQVVRPRAASQQQQADYHALGQARVSANLQTSRMPANIGGADAAQRANKQAGRQQQPVLPGTIITEGEPLLVSCNISDEFVARRLREQPNFQLAWYKNGRLIRASQQQQPQQATAPNSSSAHPAAEHPADRQQQRPAGNQRLQFVGPNGRQMYFSTAIYSDAGDYLCSWSRLPARQQTPEPDNEHSATAAKSNTPLAAGSQHQLLAPVKLRPFKSAYHVKVGDEMRLVCQLQRGFPAAQLDWYVGNRLVDGDFLREHADQFRVLQYAQATGGALAQQQLVLSSPAPQKESDAQRLVEVNPIPALRQQMQLTANGRGSWLEFYDLRKQNSDVPEKLAIETGEQQLRYMRAKLTQLTGQQFALTSQTDGDQQQQQSSAPLGATLGAISVLVVNKLAEEHSTRYSCRATTRANTDEVTTVIRVIDSATFVVKPSNGAATLTPGQPLHFECSQVGMPNPQFIWYKRDLRDLQDNKRLLQPNDDDTIEIHNERLTLTKPNYGSLGDYICSALSKLSASPEEAEIKLRAQPFIEDFGVETSHTGRSATIGDGERLELTCRVPDESTPVNITWLRSDTSDDERSMVALPEIDSKNLLTSEHSQAHPQGQIGVVGPSTFVQANGGDLTTTAAGFAFEKTYSSHSIIVERVNNFTKRLIIDQVGPEHRGYYTCLVDNFVTERSQKTIFIRVKDKIVALWPFLAILAELFILFTIIHVWETRKAYKETQQITSASSLKLGDSKHATPSKSGAATKRAPTGPANAFESVPLNT